MILVYWSCNDKAFSSTCLQGCSQSKSMGALEVVGIHGRGIRRLLNLLKTEFKYLVLFFYFFISQRIQHVQLYSYKKVAQLWGSKYAAAVTNHLQEFDKGRIF